ncbi:MAG: alpha-ketoacid dehydrogenase subunit beta [Thermoleophilia bacterium]|nr:alpha-ketoacid dehydrogenase subunit beta [Thermoleophilia bacterium]
MPELRVVDAINEALACELECDPAVLLLGEDVALGGPFGATAGLAERFGEDRVRNTPISEATVMGLAVGAATAGARPVVEVMFADFLTLGMDQLVNHAAKLRYMTGGQLAVPLTVRSTFGAGGGWGAHHSQSLEAWLAHVPGLKVGLPSCPADAWGILRAAIRDDGPVVVLEHRGLYFARGEVSTAGEPLPLGRAAVRRQGRDATVVALARMVPAALEAAARLAVDGIEIEVIDPRTLVPLDLDLITASVRRTHRLVVAHEAVIPWGPGAEIAALVQEAAFDDLDHPVLRVGAPRAPVPASPALERVYLPDADGIEVAVRSALARASVDSSRDLRAVP